MRADDDNGGGSCELTRDRSGRRWLVAWFDEFGRCYREQVYDTKEEALFAFRFEG